MARAATRGAYDRALNVLVAALAIIILFSGCDPGASTPAAPGDPTAVPVSARKDGVQPYFREVAAEVGLTFRHFSGATTQNYFSEIMGSGVALFDYDGDGDLDVYLIQGATLEGTDPATLLFPAPEDASDRLFRNDLSTAADGTITLRFTDVTESSGITARRYGMGVATGDYDNDGDVDLYVTCFGSNQLFRNNGNGTFTDVTAMACVDDPRWSSSAVFVDYDRDGDLDLFVCNYVDFQLGNHKECFSEGGVKDYCSPKSYSPVPDRLFQNQGDGTFIDVTRPSRIARAYGAGLGVVSLDSNQDGWPDLYVANDQTPNQLWINRRDGTFEDIALRSGCAVNRDGLEESGMGVDAGDYDGDGDEDLILSHLNRESNTLYVNSSRGFTDQSVESGLGAPSWNRTGWGTCWIDYDNDGHLDLFVANGAVNVVPALYAAGEIYPYHQPNQLFHNLGDGRFEDVSERGGPGITVSEVTRGAAAGDIDNDGDIDLLLSNSCGPVRLLLNDAANRHPWIGLRLVDARGVRDQLGAFVEVELEDGRRLCRRSRSGGSYCAARDPRVLVGLGAGGSVRRLTVHWPDGSRETWGPVPVRTWTVLPQGTGTACR